MKKMFFVFAMLFCMVNASFASPIKEEPVSSVDNKALMYPIWGRFISFGKSSFGGITIYYVNCSAIYPQELCAIGRNIGTELMEIAINHPDTGEEVIGIVPIQTPSSSQNGDTIIYTFTE